MAKNPHKELEFDASQNWSKEESEELILLYLQDYYRTLDDYYLKEALMIALEDGIDFQRILHRAQSELN